MRGIERVKREEGQAQQHLRERRDRIAAQVGQEHRDRLRPPGADQQPGQHRQELGRDDAHDRHRPEPAGTGQHGPSRDQQRQQRRRDEAAAQVVQDLPAPDDRQRVPRQAVARRHERKEPQEDLPVAADPAVLPACVGEHARRVVVHQFHVRDQCRPRVEPLEEIVRQQRVLRYRLAERRREGVDVVQPLPGEDALPEEVLIGVGHGGRVRVDAGVSGIQPREERARGAHERHADPRLQDAVALRDPADRGIERGAIERMRDDADELSGHAPGQPRVAVERDAVPDLRQHGQIADDGGEARVGGAAQQPIELLDLAALAFPSHPSTFAGVPLPQAMEEEEPVGATVRVPGVERGNARLRRRQNGGIARQRLRRGVREVAEDGEVDVRVDVAERLHLEMGEQALDALHAVEQGRDDHHRPRRRRYRVELEARKPSRRNQRADHPLQQLYRQLARGHDRQEHDTGQRRAGPAVQPGVGDGRGDEQRRAGRDAAEIAEGRMREEEPPGELPAGGPPGDAVLELPAAPRQSGDGRCARRAPPGSARGSAARARRTSGRAAAVLHRSAPPGLRRRGGSGRGCGSPSAHRCPPGRAAAPARRGSRSRRTPSSRTSKSGAGCRSGSPCPPVRPPGAAPRRGSRPRPTARAPPAPRRVDDGASRPRDRGCGSAAAGG
jgi:hypothetical protein